MKKIIFILLLSPSLVFGQLTNGKIIANRPTGGNIVGDTMKIGALYLKQTTAGKTIAIGNFTSGTNLVYITNLGTVSVTMSPGGALDTSAMFTYRWTGTKWAVSAGNSSSGGPGIDTTAIHKTGNETIRSGIKTFAVSPSVPTPSTGADATNKGYVDGKLAAKQDSGTALLRDGSRAATGNIDVGGFNAINVNLVKVNDGGGVYNTSNNAHINLQADGHITATGTGVNASKVLVTDASNNVISSTVSSTTLSYLDATSSVQTQINSKASSSSVAAKRDSALAPGKIVIGQTYGGGLAVTPSGDFTITNAGVFSLVVDRMRCLVPTSVKTTTYSASANDFVPCDNTSGSFTVTLPNAPADRTVIGVKMVIQGGTNTITIACAGSDVINKTGGSTSGTVSYLNQCFIFQYKSSTGIWYVIADDLPKAALDGIYATLTAVATNTASIATHTTAIARIDSSLNSSYTALTSGASIAIDYGSKRNPSFTLTSGLTAITFTISNSTFAADAYIDYSKTTATNAVLTFPANTIITDQNGDITVGTAVTIVSTTITGRFDIILKKTATGYRAIVKQTVS
jgi:hypothetical protein